MPMIPSPQPEIQSHRSRRKLRERVPEPRRPGRRVCLPTAAASSVLTWKEIRTAMAIVAHTRPIVIGVDTHARNHSFAVLTAPTGEQIAAKQFPTTSAGLKRAVAWVSRLIGADLTALWVIEGAATYGARLARVVTDAGYEVAEAARMDARTHHRIGKSDPLDAYRIGASVLPLEDDRLRHPRADAGLRPALRVLTSARENMSSERTASVNALTALLRTADLGLDARKPLTNGVREVNRQSSRFACV